MPLWAVRSSVGSAADVAAGGLVTVVSFWWGPLGGGQRSLEDVGGALSEYCVEYCGISARTVDMAALSIFFLCLKHGGGHVEDSKLSDVFCTGEFSDVPPDTGEVLFQGFLVFGRPGIGRVGGLLTAGA